MKPRAPPVRGMMLSFSAWPAKPGSRAATAAQRHGCNTTHTQGRRAGWCSASPPGQQSLAAVALEAVPPGSTTRHPGALCPVPTCVTLLSVSKALPAAFQLIQAAAKHMQRAHMQREAPAGSPVATRACPTSCRATTLFSTPCREGRRRQPTSVVHPGACSCDLVSRTAGKLPAI